MSALSAATTGDDTLIALHDIRKVYNAGLPSEVEVLHGIDWRVRRGEFVALIGPSGSGKSTLLYLLGALDRPTSGAIHVEGRDLASMSEPEMNTFRRDKVGFIFQSFNLIPRTTALANVELPLLYRGVGRRERRERAAAALASVGLSDRASHQPNELSGGQQQRVAVARALVAEPSLLLADEPTGNLDSQATSDVLDLMDAMHDEGRTIVMITHEDDVAARADRVITLVDGMIAAERRNRP